jgi:hypothetical protein
MNTLKTEEFKLEGDYIALLKEEPKSPIIRVDDSGEIWYRVLATGPDCEEIAVGDSVRVLRTFERGGVHYVRESEVFVKR